MSLELIRALRMNRQKPDGVVSVVVADKPLPVPDSASVVVIRSTDQPQFMDFRPLVGVWVAVYSRNADAAHVMRLMDALHAAKVKFFGVVNEEFVLPMTTSPTPRHTELLTNCWSRLCP